MLLKSLETDESVATMSSFEEVEKELDRKLKIFFSNPDNLQAASENVFENLLEEVILGVVFEVHRSVKTGLFEIEEAIQEDANEFRIVDAPDLDIFGQQPIKKPQECTCPSCKRSLAALRFAPHLEKCMGMGRNSSRIASRRIANNSKESVGYGGMMSDDDDDADWTVGSDRRRKKRDRNGTKRSRNPKAMRNGDVSSETSVSSDVGSHMSYDGMTNDEKKTLLTQICGVISEHTRKLCTRSMRCPQHTDEQRRLVRATLLQHQEPEMNGGPELLHVDGDIGDEVDGQSMRESMGRGWEQEHSNTSSPADSASTSSSSSKKREKIPKSKSKSSKNHKGSPSFHNSHADL